MSVIKKHRPARQTIVGFLVGIVLTAVAAATGIKLDFFQKPVADAANKVIDKVEDSK